MMNFKKITAFALCLITAVSFVSACKKDETNTPVVPEIKETQYDLVAGGESGYKIVLPNAPRGYEEYAARELADNFYKSSMVTLPIVGESAVTFSDNSRLLLIGETSAAASAGIKADKNQFGARGFVLKRAGTNICFLGGDTTGTLYAVYEFLHRQFGYEPYAENEIALEENVTEKKLLDFDLTEIPDIAYNSGTSIYYARNRIMEGHRMRFNQFSEIFVNTPGSPWHNTFKLMPLSTYNDPEKPETYHPKWFVHDKYGSQLHYTAHGDEQELELMREEVLQLLINYIEADFAAGKYYEYVGFMHEDVLTWAQNDGEYAVPGQPDSVEALKAKYGSAYGAAMLIQFINPVADRLREYMEENWDGRRMNITIFAYVVTEEAPVKQLSDGSYAPIDESVKTSPNVNMFLAPIYADYIKEYADNEVLMSTVEKWKGISDQLSFWFYDYYCYNSFIYFDSVYSLQSFYRAARNANAKYVFNELICVEEQYTPFRDLKLYLTSKLTWKVDYNVETLVDAFFENYYKEAAGSMRAYFESLRTYCAYVKGNKKLAGHCIGYGHDSASVWEEGALNGFMQLIQQAYEDIKPLETVNPAKYRMLYDRICMESLMPRYLTMQYYAKENFNDASLAGAVSLFKADAARLNMLYYGSSGGVRFTIESLEFSR